MIEYEKKYRLKTKNLQSIILKLGFKNKNSQLEKDTYYSRPDIDFMKTRECLRVRVKNQSSEITYKPGTSKKMHESKAIWKEEVNVIVQKDQLTNVDHLLELLGYIKLCTVEKKRVNFVKDNITISIDEVKNVGSFVEIEILAHNDNKAINKINVIAKNLGITEKDIETLPYRDLVMLANKQ